MSEDELREALARKLSTWVIGNMPENSWLCADALLAGPLAPLLAKVQAVEAIVKDHDYAEGALYDIAEVLGIQR